MTRVYTHRMLVLLLALAWPIPITSTAHASAALPMVERVEPLPEDPLAKAPGVIFHENLDTIANLKDSFQDVGSDQGRFRIDTIEAFSGTKAIAQTYLPKGELTGDPGNAGWCWRFFGDNPRSGTTRGGKPVYTAVARWYHKFEPGFEPRDGTHYVPKFARMRSFNSKDWKGNYSILYWIAGKDGHLSIERHTRAPGAHREWLPNHAARFEFGDPINIGRWIHFEMRVSIGDKPRSDHVQAWADGVMICDIRNDDLSAGFRKQGLNGMSWDCYWNRGSPKRQSRYFDDLMLGTQAIGPARTPLNPVIVLSPATGAAAPKSYEVEVAEGNQAPLAAEKKSDNIVTRHAAPKIDYTTVWKGTAQGAPKKLTVNTQAGSFVGSREGQEALAENQLHFVRLRQQAADGTWSAWSSWHAGFATTWSPGAATEKLLPPKGYLTGE